MAGGHARGPYMRIGIGIGIQTKDKINKNCDLDQRPHLRHPWGVYPSSIPKKLIWVQPKPILYRLATARLTLSMYEISWF